jgi:hypothetical protein
LANQAESSEQVTSQIIEPEINVTFRYNPKKVRRAWGISQVIRDLILDWFLKNTQMQTRGSTELFFKNLLYHVHKEKVWRIVTKIVDFSDGIPAQTYTMFASEKVSERNENCRFQPAYVRKVIAEKSCQVGEIRRG